MPTVVNPLRIETTIGTTQVVFEQNPTPKRGCLSVSAAMFAKTSAAADLMKGMRDSCQLFQSMHKEAPFLAVGMGRTIEHWKTVSGYAFGALAAPYWFTVASKVQDKAAKKQYDVEFSRHLTELTAVTTYAVSPWISNKALSGGVGSVGKVLILWPQVFDLQAAVRKLFRLVPLVDKAVDKQWEDGLNATILETSLMVGKIALALFATIVSVVSILTGMVPPVGVAIAVLAASLGSVILNLTAAQCKVSAPFLAI